MTTRVTQGAIGVAYTAVPPPVRVTQAAVGVVYANFPSSSPVRVTQAAIAIVARRFPVQKLLEVFPSRETFQTKQPKKRVDLL